MQQCGTSLIMFDSNHLKRGWQRIWRGGQAPSPLYPYPYQDLTTSIVGSYYKMPKVIRPR